MLTIDELNRITKEVTLGMPPSLKTHEANLFREQVTKDIAKIKKKGQVVILPGE